LRDCDVEGKIPDDLNGTFYRVGPDFQYPPVPGNIPFDGEGHVSMFRFKNGHVDFKSRYARTQRFKAQAEARRTLFGMYRNPFTDDPSVKGLSRSTANTHVVHHNGRLLALKEDSRPVAMDPHTLETLDDCLDFDSQLESETFTAHPKFDPETGEMIAFGYEAKGFMTDDINVFSVDRKGTINWSAWIKVPYVGMLHDFAVTQKHIAFLAVPMVADLEQMKNGGVHFAWDTTLPSWFGVMRRGSDGSDLRWYEGPECCATHVMGAFSDGDKVYVDMDLAPSNQFPFFPYVHGERFDPAKATGYVHRLSVDLSKKADNYDMEVMYPTHGGVLPRQDDRYNTVPYNIGFMPVHDPDRPFKPETGPGFPPNNCYTMFNHANRKTSTFWVGDSSSLQECCFAPRSRNAPEGNGYLIGMANRLLEGGRSDLLILDTQSLEDGPVATIRMPFQVYGQIHGWWVSEEAFDLA
ncbi:MAG: carotenoid oxygenase family protein, partial [Gammaproteobacteria bacterium]